jgi:hypothetical protein
MVMRGSSGRTVTPPVVGWTGGGVDGWRGEGLWRAGLPGFWRGRLPGGLPYVLAELDYLISTRIGVAAELAMLRELTSPAYELVMMSAADLGTAADIVERYLTPDPRHFHALRALDGERFELCP